MGLTRATSREAFSLLDKWLHPGGIVFRSWTDCCVVFAMIYMLAMKSGAFSPPFSWHLPDFLFCSISIQIRKYWTSSPRIRFELLGRVWCLNMVLQAHCQANGLFLMAMFYKSTLNSLKTLVARKARLAPSSKHWTRVRCTTPYIYNEPSPPSKDQHCSAQWKVLRKTCLDLWA